MIEKFLQYLGSNDSILELSQFLLWLHQLKSNVNVKCKKWQLFPMDLTTFQIYLGRGWLHKNLNICSNHKIIIIERDATSLFFKQWWGKICPLHMSVSACLAALMMQEYCTCPVYGKLVETNAKMAYTTKSQMLPTPPRSDANTLSECWHFDTSVNTLQLCACFKMTNGWKNFYRAQ